MEAFIADPMSTTCNRAAGDSTHQATAPTTFYKRSLRIPAKRISKLPVCVDSEIDTVDRIQASSLIFLEIRDFQALEKLA